MENTLYILLCSRKIFQYLAMNIKTKYRKGFPQGLFV